MKKYKTTANLNQRKGTNTNYPKVQTIPKGSIVSWYGYSFMEDGVEWKLVEFNGKMGFCSANYLKAV